MKILTVFSRLLDYPTAELAEQQEAIMAAVRQDDQLNLEQKRSVSEFLNAHLEQDLLDWQCQYDALFERGRSLSLMLFEHIHGESRDRGQAMVDLLAQYHAAGLDIGVKELPDYIPLFLEFISTQGDQLAREWLEDVAPILALLAVRLEKRESDYGALFHVLLSLSGTSVTLSELREKVAGEERDDTNKALDKVWEEEAITFGGDAINGGCPSMANRPTEGQRRDEEMPLQFTDAASPAGVVEQARN